jgi:predicted  nucleic acid-binding Zn ribbon protein
MVLNPLSIALTKEDLFPNPDFPHEGTPLEALPFECLQCHQSIAFARFRLHPVRAEMIRTQVYEWSQLYFAIDYLRRRAYLSWAEAQLTDATSAVNQLGREISADLQDLRPCYYSIFLLDHIYLLEDRSACPNCQRPMQLFSDRVYRDPAYLCSSCSLAIRVTL